METSKISCPGRILNHVYRSARKSFDIELRTPVSDTLIETGYIMYCLQWLIPVLFIPKPTNIILLQNQVK